MLLIFDFLVIFLTSYQPILGTFNVYSIIYIPILVLVAALVVVLVLRHHKKNQE